MNVFTPRLDHYRIYNDDGSEAASTPVAAEDTAPTIAAQFGATVDIHLRVLLQETLGVSGTALDNWQLQVNKNAAGFVDVTQVSPAYVLAFFTGNLTDGGNTTDRATNGLTAGSGSFVAGRQCEDGLLDNHQLTASNFTEHVYALRLVGNDLANGDQLTFRVLFDGGTFTHNVTPTINVTQTNPTIAAAAMADEERNWTTPYQDIAILFSEAVDGAPAVDATIPGLTCQVNGGASQALTYQSGDGTANWKVRRAELIQQDDTVVLDYAMASGVLLAVDDNAELRETVDAAVMNNLTKRVHETIKDKNNAAVASESMSYGIHEFDSGNPANANWMTRTNKGSSSTDASGVLDVQYTGATAVGGTVYLAIERTAATPDETVLARVTIQ